MTLDPHPTPALAHTFVWEDSGDDGSAGTRGLLEIRRGDEILWAAGDFSWTWWEVLEWLAENWNALVLHDGLPRPYDVADATELREAVLLDRDQSSSVEAQRLEEEMYDFLESHDLDRALHGATRSPIVIWRTGLLGTVLTSTRRYTDTWTAVEAFLTSLGDAVAERIRTSGSAATTRLLPVVEAWENRGADVSGGELAAAAGLDEDQWDAVTAALGDEADLHISLLTDSALYRSELLVAARMSAGLPPAVISQVLEELRSLPRGPSLQSLDDVAALVSAAVSLVSGAEAFEQGYEAAHALRRELALEAHDRFDPVAWLRQHGVHHRERPFTTPLIDALACWGASLAPAVIINTNGQHSRSTGARNASAAHEIGHLLLDRHGALPAAEVLGGRVAPDVERRAGAFAAEVLVPRSTAGRSMRLATKSNVVEVLRTAARAMSASPFLFARQALNSEYVLDVAVRTRLETIAPPGRFR